jgi:multidrug efflux pump subunit AcrB
MNLADFVVKNKSFTYFTIVLMALGGIAGFFSLGQLEDPEYTVKTATIVTSYPGASPDEVEQEVTDRIEAAVQEMKQIKWIESYSRPGESHVKVEMLPEFWGESLQTVWEQMRRKIRKIEGSLPPGAGRPKIFDDFGDVYGFLLALTGDGFNPAEMEYFAKRMQKELSLVQGVARVNLWGVQPKVVYLDVRASQLGQLGLSDDSIEATLALQSEVVDAGNLNVGRNRFRIAPTGSFKSPQDIAELTIRPSFLDTMQSGEFPKKATGSSELIRIKDIGNIRRGYMEPPPTMLRYNGEPAIGISITNRPGVNIVEVGQAIDRRIEEIAPQFPVGIDIFRVHWQSDIVAAAVKGFMVNFAEAVAIVLVVITLFMGWRMGIIIGSALIGTILGTFILMSMWDIPLQRMSLGALVIALGMMVDNAIVVADGMVVRLEQGVDRTKAAVEAANQPSMSLLGATVVAVMAFYPISASPESTGEYCLSLFTVVAISLMISWVLSVTLTPLMCIDMIPDPKETGGDPYGGRLFQAFRRFLSFAIRVRFITMAVMIGLLVLSVVGFGFVTNLFFPASSMDKFMIDFRLPEGARIETLAKELKIAETRLLKDHRVASVSAFIGSGPPRFYLPVEPEERMASYAQLIVNVKNFREIDQMLREMEPWFSKTFPDAVTTLRKFDVGPGKTWKFEVRVSGSADAPPAVLRGQAEKYLAILKDEPLAGFSRLDWRQRVMNLEPQYNQQRGRWADVTRKDLAKTTKRAYDGRVVGMYREKDDLIPIVLRHVEEERAAVGDMGGLQIKPAGVTEAVPLAQVTDGEDLVWQESQIRRRDRRRTIKVQANPILGETNPTLVDAVRGKFEAIELPPGYTMEWGGEQENTEDSQKALVPGIIPAVAIMALIIVALYNAFKPPLIIAITIPFALIGITAGLLGTNTPFGFMSLLGAMSLAGMMIKNAIVLLDEVIVNRELGKPPYQSVMDAALSRTRPVVLAAATTVLGVIPLLQDVFWVGMAVAIMAGLTFGTVLTLVMVPVLYAIMYRIKSSEQGEA